MASVVSSNSTPREVRTIPYYAIEKAAIYWLTAFALLGITVANQTHIETNDAVKLAGTLEISIRLGFTGLAGLLGAYGFLFVPKIREAFYSFPGFWILGIAFFYVLGTALSPLRGYAFPYLVTCAAVLLFSPMALYTLGSKRFVQVIMLSMFVSMLASWFLYLAMPEYGVVIEITDDAGTESVQRMGGTSHPNTLAGTSVLMMVFLAYLYFEKRISAWVAAPLVLLCVATLLETGTRVALLAGFFSIAFVYRDVWWRKDVLPISVIILLMLPCIGIYVLADDSVTFGSAVAQSTTRSGDIEEISTVTGRAEIWQYVIEMIAERPLQGYGPGTAKYYLEQQGMLLHCHNVVLNLAWIGGFTCGVFALLMFLNQLFVSIRGEFKLAALISFVIIVNSLTETPIFDYVPGLPTVLWLAAIFWPVLHDDSI